MTNVSVLLATHRRSHILEETLQAMSRLDTAGVTWELIVVDNAGDDATRQACQKFAATLPLSYLVCTEPGKNAALNYGLAHLQGELVVLTDDDVLPAPQWLRETWAGACRWPDHVLFGGRVLPRWPGKSPAFDLSPAFGRWTFGIYDPQLDEGPRSDVVPLGANMAVRRCVFDDMRFNEQIGPRGSNYAMGSETELIRRLCLKGHAAVFLPNSMVYHIIRPEQLQASWLVGRAFRQGRGETRLRKHLTWLATARLAKQAVWASARLRLGRHAGANEGLSVQLASALARGRLYEALRIKFHRSPAGSLASEPAH